MTSKIASRRGPVRMAGRRWSTFPLIRWNVNLAEKAHGNQAC